MAENNNNRVICDKCHRHIKIQLKRKKKGDLEYRYFTCKYCNTSYVVSATDPPLRREMQRYEDLVKQANALAKQAQELLQKNVQRCREIMDQNPLEL